jgi:hypothetical protein
VTEAAPVKVNEATLKAMSGLITRAKNRGVIEDAEAYRQRLRQTYLVQSARDLTQAQADEVITSLTESIQEREALATA